MHKLLFFIIITAFSTSAFAARGAVILYKETCNYYVVESAEGYTVLKWTDGPRPQEDDIIVGDFESYGLKYVLSVLSDARMTVWIEDYRLDKSRAITVYYDRCDAS